MLTLSQIKYESTALIAGLFFPLAFAPFNYTFLAPVSLALLFASWMNSSTRRAIIRGYLFGLGMFAVGISFVYISMHDFRGASVATSITLTAILVAYFSLFTAFAAGISTSRLLRQKPAIKLYLVFPAVWVLVEWLRSWFFVESPWLQGGYSQMDTPLTGLGPITGLYGISWATAFTASALVSIVHLKGWRRFCGIIACTLIWISAGYLKQFEWTQPAGPAFKVTLLQGNVPQDRKWQPEYRQSTLDLYATMTREHWDSQVVIWPETAVPAYYHEVKDNFLKALDKEAQLQQTDLLLGIPMKGGAGRRKKYNALISLGTTEGIYQKRHLVPFGEFLPLQPLSGMIADFLDISVPNIASGEANQALLYAAGYPLMASICYEGVFGEDMRSGLPQASYLVNVTNDAWFADSIAPHQHLQMTRMRALESGRYLLRATNTGITAIVAPDGQIVSTAPQFEQAALSARITPMKGSTIYIRYGDKLILSALVLSLLIAMRLPSGFYSARSQNFDSE